MKAMVPPFTLTSVIVNLCTKISERVGALSVLGEHTQSVQLLRLSRIRTIHGSLAIEGNTLSEEQITAILDGKRVMAPPRDIQEAHNAISAYERMHDWTAHQEADLLNAHRCLMTGLLADAGQYRGGGVGVMSNEQVIHMAPPASRVPILMRQLLRWLDTTGAHPLVASSVFHYEFEFIHPFADGNGRMGRLWQTLILSQWRPVFAYIPVESLVHQNQSDYYAANQESTRLADSGPFITFMLSMIQDALADIVTPHAAPHVTHHVEKLLSVLKSTDENGMSRDEIMTRLLLSDRTSFSERYLKPALQQGLLALTLPDKPRSPLQRYKLTSAGLALVRHFG